MPIPTLVEMALSRIPYAQVPTMTLQQKTVVHYELFPRAFLSRSVRGRPLYRICYCVHFGRCLCYLEQIRTEMVEQYWGDPTKYVVLSGWFSDI